MEGEDGGQGEVERSRAEVEVTLVVRRDRKVVRE